MARPRKIDQLTGGVAGCDDRVVHVADVRAARAALPPVAMVAGLAELFAGLGDPTRLRIVAALADRELCVCDVAATVGQSESAVSHQLRVLRDLGLVCGRREGRRIYYALDDEHVLMLYRQSSQHVAHQLGEGSDA